jgi:O-antigen ligase
VLLPAAFLGVAAALARDRRLRVGALVLLVPLAAILYLTYSRTPIVALFLVAVVIAWRIRPRLGAGLLVVGLVAGALLVPSYLQFRGEQVGATSAIPRGELLIATDQLRLQGWAGALRMWADEPLLGHGFKSYTDLAGGYGVPLLGAPHNEWLRFFAEEGTIVGFAALWFAFDAFARVWARRGWLMTALAAAFAVYVLAACFNNPFLFVQTNVAAFTIAGTALALAVLRRPAEDEAEAEDRALSDPARAASPGSSAA